VLGFRFGKMAQELVFAANRHSTAVSGQEFCELGMLMDEDE
jgi:hypothetical protein